MMSVTFTSNTGPAADRPIALGLGAEGTLLANAWPDAHRIPSRMLCLCQGRGVMYHRPSKAIPPPFRVISRLVNAWLTRLHACPLAGHGGTRPEALAHSGESIGHAT